MNTSMDIDKSRNTILFNPDDERREKEGNVVIVQIPFRNCMIVLLDHPSTITVYQHVSIEVISGTVTVFGFELKRNNPPFTVFSSERTGLIQIKTETYERIWKKKEGASNLEEDLFAITQDRDLATSTLKKFGNFTVAIVVKRCVYPASLQFLELYYPHVLEFNLFKKKLSTKDYYYVPKSMRSPMEFNQYAENLAIEINFCIRNSRLTEVPAPRVLVYGPKNTGKSSLLRFLINKMLTSFMEVFYLDADPGQTEFTPPGLVSLTKLTKPITGPPFTHLKKPISMIFIGGISAETSPDMYHRSICKLMELYMERHSEEPLFINTMGWVEGLGLHFLKNVISTVKPTMLVELVNEDEVSMLDCRQYLPEDGLYFQMCRTFMPDASHLSSQEMRNMALLAYFGKFQSKFEGPQYLNEVKPYCVSWDKIPIYICGKKVPPYRMVEAINASIVALCKVPETSILESDIIQFQKTLGEEPDNECLGYGIVRAIDEKDHLLYIVSPLSLKDLQNVNAIIKGNIMLPDAILLKQPIYNMELPYTNVMPTPPPVVDEEMADISIMTLKSTSDIESPAANSTARSSVNLSKKIPKRYRRHMGK